MDLLTWVTFGIIILGFSVLISMKKEMKSRLVAITEGNMGENESATKPLFWWVVGSFSWGIVCLILVASWFLINIR